MNKKLIVKLGILGVLAVAAVGGTIALFNDTETSAGNILVAGELDLKVDHLKQTYLGADCKTCSVTVVSDESNMVIEKNGGAIPPYNAVLAWVHPVWTSQNDSELLASNAKWIWEHNPTRPEDTTATVTYTFEKDFQWWGPIVSTDLYMAVGSDNSVWVYLNGVLIGSNTGEFGYLQGSMLQIPAGNITPNVLQGGNVLKFVVQNWGLPNGTPQSNPAGLIYKFSIDGNCGDNYFKTNCRLWGEKDLETGDTFFKFDDVKPGDYGTNLISLHVYDNDAWACLNVDKTGIESEDISKDLNVVVWEDEGDGIYEVGEDVLYQGDLVDADIAIADHLNGTKIIGDTTKYIGLAWCFGNQTVSESTATITCDGSSIGNEAQGDTLSATLTALVEQWRNNAEFECNPED